jgi:hypothetical protein
VKEIEDAILRNINERKIDSVRQLVYYVAKETGSPEKVVLTVIQELEDTKSLGFFELSFPQTFNEYILSLRAKWYWVTLGILTLSILSIFLISANSFPGSYLRNFLGLLFVIYLPGYSVIKTLYPISVPLKTPSITLDSIERIVLSLSLSLALTPIVGLVLYLTPWGLNLFPVTLSLILVTAVFSSIGIFHQYQKQKSLFTTRITTVIGYEFGHNMLSFFDAQGLIKKRLVVVKTIPVSEITDVNSGDCEVSITSNGITNIFLMRSVHSAIDLRDRLRGIILARSKQR